MTHFVKDSVQIVVILAKERMQLMALIAVALAPIEKTIHSQNQRPKPIRIFLVKD
jgi:hypothetical protein